MKLLLFIVIIYFNTAQQGAPAPLLLYPICRVFITFTASVLFIRTPGCLSAHGFVDKHQAGGLVWINARLSATVWITYYYRPVPGKRRYCAVSAPVRAGIVILVTKITLHDPCWCI